MVGGKELSLTENYLHSDNSDEMTIKHFLLICLGFYLWFGVYDDYVPLFAVCGVYKNTNFEYSPVSPRRSDRLTLNSDYTFSSRALGSGTYTLKYDFFKGTRIELKSDSGFDLDLDTKIDRTWIGKPRIWIFYDLSHFYKKI